MRSIAIVVAAVLLTIFAGCAFASCVFPIAAASQCCHKRPPCAPKQEIRDCAYTLLERTKTTPAVLSAAMPLAPVPSPLAPVDSIRPAERLADSSGLYLRIRVLLI